MQHKLFAKRFKNNCRLVQMIQNVFLKLPVSYFCRTNLRVFCQCLQKTVLHLL